MKTLVLATVSAAALLAAGVASAQTTGTVEGQLTNAKNAAQAMTTDGGVVASSYINQYGDSNQASVDQVAGVLPNGFNSSTTTEKSVILQGWNGVKAYGNVANVTQSGGNDVSTVMQRNDYPATGSAHNNATVTQRGANLGAFTYQYGAGNTSSINQTSQDNNSYVPGTNVNSAADFANGQNTATSFHGADQTYSHRNDVGATVVQDETQGGNVNITQQAPNNGASVSQWYAERDTVNINQTAYPGAYYAGSKIATYQSGRDSEISITQGGQGNSTAIMQVSADQDGAAYGVVGADDSFSNHGFVTQNGTGNTVLDLQAGSNNVANTTQATGSMLNTADVRQVGTNNEAYTTQSGAMSLSYIGQSGNNNYASVSQTGGSSSLITQTGNASNGTRGNSATVSQSYFNEVSKIDQTGQNNVANVTQGGYGDYSLVSQTGTGSAGNNTASITQMGDRAMSLAYQNGSGNMISVSQHK